MTDLTPRLTALAERCPDFYRECKGEREWLAEILMWLAKESKTPALLHHSNGEWSVNWDTIKSTPLEAALSAAEAVVGIMHEV